MKGTASCKPPAACTERELREFAVLVRQGVATADGRLEARIRAARWLAFSRGTGDELAAVAALKSPDEHDRAELFEKAAAPVRWLGYDIELGWVFVLPAHRGNGIARHLCRLLLERVAGAEVFATTRTDNRSMIRILGALGFAPVGRPYPRRAEQLALFLRPPPPAAPLSTR